MRYGGCADDGSDDVVRCMAEADETLPRIAGRRGRGGDFSLLDAYVGVFTEKGGPVLQRECDTGEGELSVLAPRTGSAHGAVLRPVVLEGRAPDPTRADEVTANLAAAGMGIHVGQTISASIGEFCPEDASRPGSRSTSTSSGS